MIHSKRIFFSVLSTLLILSGFQNCSSSDLEFTDLASKALFEEFEYSYSKKPTHFLQSLFILDAAPNPSMRFRVRVFVGTPVENSNDGEIKVSITSPSGQLLCPEEILSLSGGKKDWELTCVPPITFSKAHVKMELVGTNSDFITEKVYSLD